MRVVGVDRNGELDAGRLRETGVEVVLGAEDPALVDDVDLLVKSPGIPSEAALVAAARARGVASGASRARRRILANPLLGVTGTNGKTTTCELLGEIFRAAGRPVAVAGNVGRPLTGLDGTISGRLDRLRAVELPARGHRRARPRVGVLLNVTPDHLDRHGDLDSYRAAKLRIFENQGPTTSPSSRAASGCRERGAASSSPSTTRSAEPRIPGEHNRENAAAATAAARAAGIPTTRSGRRCGASPACRTGSSSSGSSTASAGSTTRRRRTPRPSALGAYPPGLRVILGGSRKGTPFGGLAGRAREAACPVPTSSASRPTRSRRRSREGCASATRSISSGRSPRPRGRRAR